MNEIYITAHDVITKLKKLIKRFENDFDITETPEISRKQFRVIFPIFKDNQGYSAAELAKLMAIDKAFVSRTIADLESKGIACREKKAESNERNYKIVLTEKGKEIIDKQTARAKQMNREMYNTITPQEHEIFDKVLNKLTE